MVTPLRRTRDEGPPNRWRVIRDGEMDGALNMAVDHALAAERWAGEAVLRLYRWVRPTLSFGRNEPARGLYDPDAAGALGAAFVRRPTGGRAVLHDQELTYAVVLGVGALGGPKETYRRINEALVDAMRALGVPASLAPGSGRPVAPDAGPCFDLPAEGEVVAGGRKLVGSAQVRIGRSILQHGSIILDGSQDLIIALGGPSPEPPATVRSVLGSVPGRDRLDEVLRAAFQGRMGGEWIASGLRGPEETAVADLLGTYTDPAWTWRR